MICIFVKKERNFSMHKNEYYENVYNRKQSSQMSRNQQMNNFRLDKTRVLGPSNFAKVHQNQLQQQQLQDSNINNNNQQNNEKNYYLRGDLPRSNPQSSNLSIPYN